MAVDGGLAYVATGYSGNGMTFGTADLLTGFKFLTAVIGLFGIGEILISMETGLATMNPAPASERPIAALGS